MKKLSQVCVYCASSTKVADKYFQAADALGEILAANGITLIYGGGAVGLMGRIADKVLSLGGDVVGVIPDFMTAVEWEHKGVSRLHIVTDMHERKKRFFVDTDAIVALPGWLRHPRGIARSDYLETPWTCDGADHHREYRRLLRSADCHARPLRGRKFHASRAQTYLASDFRAFGVFAGGCGCGGMG